MSAAATVRGNTHCSNGEMFAGFAETALRSPASSLVNARGMVSALALVSRRSAVWLPKPRLRVVTVRERLGGAVAAPNRCRWRVCQCDQCRRIGYVVSSATPSGSDFIIWMIPRVQRIPCRWVTATTPISRSSGDGRTVAGTRLPLFRWLRLDLDPAGRSGASSRHFGERTDLRRWADLGRRPHPGREPRSTGPVGVAPNGNFLGGTGPTRGRQAAYLWTEAGGFQSIGHLTNDPKEIISITALSGDAGTAAGQARRCSVCTGSGNPVYDINTAFVWRSGQGFTILPDLSSSPAPTMFNPTGVVNSAVIGISRDGSTVVGGSYGSDGRMQAVYWRSGQINPLGFVHADDFTTTARFASGNGSTIIGDGFKLAATTGWRWTAATGMQDIAQS